jgi:hypothetical protein
VWVSINSVGSVVDSCRSSEGVRWAGNPVFAEQQQVWSCKSAGCRKRTSVLLYRVGNWELGVHPAGRLCVRIFSSWCAWHYIPRPNRGSPIANSNVTIVLQCGRVRHASALD